MAVKTQTYRPTLNSGQVYLRVAGAKAPLQAVGNVSMLELEIAEDEKTLADHTQPGGGQWAAVNRVTGVNFKMTMHDLDTVNLSRGIYGSSSDKVAGTVAAEVVTAYQGGLSRLANPSPTNVVVTCAAPAWTASAVRAMGEVILEGTHVYRATVAGTGAAVKPTFKTDGTETTDGAVTWADLGVFAAVADTDYEVRKEGLMILGGGIPDGCPISVAYSYGAHAVVQALTSGAQIYELAFGGMNEADNNSPVVLDVFKAKVSAAKSIGFISDDFASLEVTGKVLMDATKTGEGVSKYFKVAMAA